MSFSCRINETPQSDSRWHPFFVCHLEIESYIPQKAGGFSA